MAFSNDDTWWVLGTRVEEREPHSPRVMASLNTRGPGLRDYFCPDCYQTMYSWTTPTCEGGYRKRWGSQSIFGGRERNIAEAFNLQFESYETATPLAYAYHAQWLRDGKKR